MKKLSIIVFILFFNLLLPKMVFAQDNLKQTQPQVFKAEIMEIIPESGQDRQQHLKVKLLSGQRQGEEASAAAAFDKSAVNDFKKGQKVIVRQIELSGHKELIVTDFLRTDSFWAIGLIFVLAVVLVSQKKGVSSLLSLGLSFVVIIKLILPLLIKGVSPVLISSLGALLIIPLTFYLSHGLKKKSHVAVVGTIVALVLSSVLANLFINNAHLTGFSSEEASFLDIEKGGELNIKGLLLASIIIGLLGTLDDITVTQSGLVFQLNENKKNLSPKKLFQQAMAIGQDHIASMVNTLVLVYTGAALPLLMIFIDNPYPAWYVINQEIVAEEIIRMLVGSIGLIVAAPLTTLLAVGLVKKEKLSSLVNIR
ncbi:MAG: YibE/F family protein [Patescibacteria group bacterium]|nr:YibE/F family protein [Patescibacteria group bacterium]